MKLAPPEQTEAIPMPDAPSTWRQADGVAVPFAQARLAYADAAHDVLVKAATRYHSIVTYKDLAESVQEATGIKTKVPMRHWIGEILGRVVDDCVAKGEPPLSALVVHQDGTVGDGYAYVLQSANLPIPEDLDQHAAEARLECHRFFGAELPPSGGQPQLPTGLAERRERAAARSTAARKAAVAERTAAICPSCFMALPATGRCDNCG